MRDDTLADAWDVEDAVQQADSPVGVERRGGNRVAEAADGVKVAPQLEGARADDRILRRIGATPVPGPA